MLVHGGRAFAKTSLGVTWVVVSVAAAASLQLWTAGCAKTEPQPTAAEPGAPAEKLTAAPEKSPSEPEADAAMLAALTSGPSRR